MEGSTKRLGRITFVGHSIGELELHVQDGPVPCSCRLCLLCAAAAFIS